MTTVWRDSHLRGEKPAGDSRGGRGDRADDKKLAFTTNRNGNQEIYVMKADGSIQTNLTNSADRNDHDPAWSPDGTKIAFEGDFIDFTDVHVWVMNADGSGQTEPTSRGGAFPGWQPQIALFAPIRFTFSGQLTTITVPLAINTNVGILVERRVHGRLVALGRVPFGLHHKGRNRIKWNFRVNGRRLKAGAYFVRVRFLDRRGHVFQFSKPFRINVPPKRR